MAIMSYAESPSMHVPLGTSSWKRIYTRGDDMINRCLFMGESQGGSVVVESCELLPFSHSVFSNR